MTQISTTIDPKLDLALRIMLKNREQRVLDDLGTMRKFILNDDHASAMFIENAQRHLEYLGLSELSDRIQWNVEHGLFFAVFRLDDQVTSVTQHVFTKSFQEYLFAMITELQPNQTIGTLTTKLRSPKLCPSVMNIATLQTPLAIPQMFHGKLFPAQAALLTKMLEVEERPQYTMGNHTIVFPC